MLKIRMSKSASASTDSLGTKEHARPTSRGTPKSSTKPIVSTTKACNEPSVISPWTAILARDVTGTPACDPASRSTRYAASSRNAPVPTCTPRRSKCSPVRGLNTATFSPRASRAYTVPVCPSWMSTASSKLLRTVSSSSSRRAGSISRKMLPAVSVRFILVSLTAHADRTFPTCLNCQSPAHSSWAMGEVSVSSSLIPVTEEQKRTLGRPEQTGKHSSKLFVSASLRMAR
mmetsp:Transcript_29698/g.78812  ORF Transcript_29698/g.78812 Transcript_29698/m.78812 type:complete len:231 (-) Transcript_29698:293-985(-)